MLVVKYLYQVKYKYLLETALKILKLTSDLATNVETNTGLDGSLLE